MVFIISNFFIFPAKHDRSDFFEDFYTTFLYEWDSRVRNFRNNDFFCQIHFIDMEKKEVRISFNHFSIEAYAYISDIREKLFPNCDDIIEGLSGYPGACPQYTEIFVCDDCNIDRNIWLNENWEAWREKYSWSGTAFLIEEN